MSNELTPRIEKASELLGVETNSLTKHLDENGISNDSTGVTVLGAKTTTIDDLVEILGSLETKAPKLKIKTAAGFLKNGLEEKPEPTPELVPSSPSFSIARELKMARPIEQWSDDDLLARYIKDREVDVELELHKRAKQDRFIVLEPSDKGYEPGKEVIDFVKSIELLKSARKGKMKNPSTLPVIGGVRPVYFITEFNINDRMTELCPICGQGLYNSYCDRCIIDFTGIDDDSRAYMNLVAKMETFNTSSASDRKALFASAKNGITGLKSEWPALAQTFDELKATQQLPQIRVITSRPSKQGKEDPFFQDGNRSVGNKKF